MQQEDDPTTDQPTGTAVAPRPKAALEAQREGVLPIIPTSIEEAQRYASGLIQADQVPDAFRFSKDILPPPGSESSAPIHRKGDVNAPLVLMGVLKVMELGVPPQTGLSGLLPLNGRFTVWGDLAAGLVQRGGQVANQTVTKIGPGFDPDLPLGEWPDDYGYEVRYWRKGQTEPYIGRFTVRDAKRARLWMNQYKKPWLEHPDRMLFNRARTFALRDGFADALMGLSIAEEIMDSMPVVEEEKRSETKRISALTDDEPVTDTEEAPETPQEEPANAEATSGGPEPEIASDGPAGPGSGENNALL
jgi:hypothetical protein